MGLDMHLYGEKWYRPNWQNPKNNFIEDGFRLATKQLELGYWRKHPDLHGFIVKEFGECVETCERVDLSTEDLEKIIEAVKSQTLPKTTGFFFGISDGSEDEKTIAVLQKAHEWVLAGKQTDICRGVYYSASW